MAQTPDEMLRSMLRNLPEKTGRPMEEWKALISDAGLTGHKEIMELLKRRHEVSQGYANLISHQVREAREGREGGPAAEEDLVSAQYSGGKEGLRSIYDRLAAEVSTFGRDVELAPRKSYVSLRREKQFGLVQPSTRTRVDVGINLKGREPSGRLEASGSFNAMVSHRVRLVSPGEVDAELLGWLKEAYEQAG